MSDIFDLAVIGGGINGCGIARDAAGRGLKVYLCEQGDLAGATSSASSKLIHGGLRYLEYYEFRLVREALNERERLLRMAPHITWPLRFVLPHHRGLRPAWLLRLGLFLYDHLGGRKLLPGTRGVALARDVVGKPLKPVYRRAFEYSDAWVQDARLVVLNAMDAAERGATVETRTRCVAARPDGDLWQVEVEGPGGLRRTLRARALVNAAGPWVARVLGLIQGVQATSKVRMVKGSHIVVPRLHDHDRAYILQNADGRIVFAIPYEGDFTLIGTTDVDYHGEPGEPRISAEETAYLCGVINDYFRRGITPDDVVYSYAGVRPLYDDGAKDAKAATRDYVLELDRSAAGALPLLSVFGGKITTYRRLAESALVKLGPFFPALGKPWTGDSTLPGGDFPVGGAGALAAEFAAAVEGLTPEQGRRLALTYGTRARRILAGARRLDDLGQRFGGGLTERELDYLMQSEWARTAEDVLWRRSKLGLRLTAEEAARLSAWMDQATRGDAVSPAA